MNSQVQNQLNMVGACIKVARETDNNQVWNGREPARFAADFDRLATRYGAITAKVALADVSANGAYEAKSAAETALERIAYSVTRALANHFKSSGDPDRHGQVDFVRTDLTELRQQELLGRATAIRDLAAGALGEPNAEGRGVTTARVDELSAAIATFSGAMSATRASIANRGALLKDIETETAALVEAVADLDDLVVQFGDTAAGRHFIDAWRRARIIVDAPGVRARANATGNGNGPAPSTTPAPASVVGSN